MAARRAWPKQQDDLRQKLNAAMQKGMDAKTRREAGRGRQGDGRGAEMRWASKDLANAGNAENKALDALRQGADATGRGNAERQQRPGQGAAKIRWAAARMAPGNMIKIPGATDLARARDILQELRRRAGQRSRPPAELDYHRPAC